MEKHAVARTLLPLIIPVYNEEEVLAELCRCLSEALQQLPADVEMLFVNDGSSDNT